MNIALDITMQLQLVAERVKLGRTSAVADLQTKLAGILRSSLGNLPPDTFATMTKQQFYSFVIGVKGALKTQLGNHQAETLAFLKSYVTADADVAALLYTQLAGGRDVAIGAEALWSKVANNIMPANGLTPGQSLAQYGEYTSQEVTKRLMQAQPNQETPAETLEALVGHDELRNVDGTLNRTARAGKSLDNTLIQDAHITTQASVMQKALGEYIWVAVLDSKTTQICRERNGEIYVFGEGPLPPAHINCRSSITGYDRRDGADNAVPDTYAEWLESQAHARDLAVPTPVAPADIAKAARKAKPKLPAPAAATPDLPAIETRVADALKEIQAQLNKAAAPKAAKPVKVPKGVRKPAVLPKPLAIEPAAPETAPEPAIGRVTPDNASDYQSAPQERDALLPFERELRDRALGEPLTDRERGMVFGYTNADYREINSALRGGTRQSRGLKADIAALDSAIGKATLPDDTILYRGVTSAVIRDVPAFLQPGAIVSDKAFVSTSLQERAASQFTAGGFEGGGYTLSIYAPKGSVALPIANGSLEYEVLLPRNSRLKILAIVGKSIKAELL